MKIAFIIPSFTLSETCIASLEYARVVQAFLPHTVIIYTPSNHQDNPLHSTEVKHQFAQFAQIVEYTSIRNLNITLIENNVDMAYSVERGENTAMPPLAVPLAVHCTHVCTDAHRHGNIYIPMTPEINEIFEPVVPRFLQKPVSEKHKIRQIIGVPEDAHLVVYYGSIKEPPDIISEFIQKVLTTQTKHNIWIVLLNSIAISLSQRIICLSHDNDNAIKLMLLNSANSIIYSQELYTLLKQNKEQLSTYSTPILIQDTPEKTYKYGYNSANSLYCTIRTLKTSPDAQNVYESSPPAVAQKFEQHIIEPLTSPKTISTKFNYYTFREGWLYCPDKFTPINSPDIYTPVNWTTEPLENGQIAYIHAPLSENKLTKTVMDIYANSSIPISIVIEEFPKENIISPAFVQAISKGLPLFYKGCPNISDFFTPATEDQTGHYIPIPFTSSESNYKIYPYRAQQMLSMVSTKGLTDSLSKLEQLSKFIINLDSEVDRYDMLITNCFDAQLYKGFQRFRAVNGDAYTISDKTIQQLFTMNYMLLRNVGKLNNVIGRCLSHYKLWKQHVNTTQPILVLEDNITLLPDTTYRLARTLVEFDHTEWDVIVIGHEYVNNHDHSRLQAITKFDTVAEKFAYLISPNGIKKLINIVEEHTFNHPINYFFSHCATDYNVDVRVHMNTLFHKNNPSIQT